LSVIIITTAATTISDILINRKNHPLQELTTDVGTPTSSRMSLMNDDNEDDDSQSDNDNSDSASIEHAT